MPTDPIIFSITANLRAAVWSAEDNPKAVLIHFQARQSEEPVSFSVTTSVPILSARWRMPQLNGGQWLSLTESQEPYRYSVALDRKFLDKPFIMAMVLQTQADPRKDVTAAEIWSRSGASPNLVYVDFQSNL